MPTIYRSMKVDNGKPMIGQSASTLGVRIGTDIVPDEKEMVHPDKGGMSIAPSIYDLPRHRVPDRLRSMCPGATGNNSLHVWKLGAGPFVEADVAEYLTLRITSPTHGLVEPILSMTLSQYEGALENTQNDWTIDETGE